MSTLFKATGPTFHHARRHAAQPYVIDGDHVSAPQPSTCVTTDWSRLRIVSWNHVTTGLYRFHTRNGLIGRCAPKVVA